MTYNGSDKHKIALFENKQDKLVAGSNITLTPQLDGTVEISASGGAANLDDLGDVDAASPENGQALVYDEEESKWVPGEAGQVDDVQMNGQSIVTNKVASFKNYVEITQSQYDALPSSKLTDGVLYCIKDTGIVEGDKYAPIIYSLEEREVGVWTDGKPLYQKTVHINSLPSSTTSVSYPHNISNIDTVCGSIAYSRWSSGAIMPLNTAQMDTTSFVYGASFFYLVSKTDIQIAVGMDRSSLSADVTIQYTKTTDVPGSGTWGTDGVPMVHYDGTERIIGTWFGETLYERTFVLTVPNQSGDYLFPNTAIPNWNFTVNVDWTINGSGPRTATPWLTQYTMYLDEFSANGLYFYFQGTANAGLSLHVTVQYTKTSS